MKTAFLTLAVLGLVASSHAQLPPPFPRPGIEKVLENEHLIVWTGVLGVKGVPTALHHHERDLVGIFLDPGHVRTRLQDGTVREGGPFARGAVAFQPRGVTHVEEVLIDGTRAVGVELKLSTRAPVSPPVPMPEDDGRTLVDNEHVIVREYAWTPGVPVRQATHGVSAVVVGLESGEIAETRPDGTRLLETVRFGEARLAPGTLTRTTTAVQSTPRAIVVTVR